MKSLISTEEVPGMMLSYLSGNCSMQQILDDLCEKFDVQIMILDLNNYILLHTRYASEGRIWAQSVKNGYLSEEFFLTQGNSTAKKLFTMYQTSNTTLFEAGEIDEFCYICKPVRNTDAQDGTLLIRFADGQRDLARSLIDALSDLHHYLAGSGTKSAEGTHDPMKTFLARELLLYDNDKNLSFFNDLCRSSWQSTEQAVPYINGRYAIAALRVPEAGSSPAALHRAQSELSRFIPRSLSIVSRETLLVFLYDLAGKTPELQGELEARMEGFVRKRRLRCGISSVFDTLSNRINYRRQALDALAVGPLQFPDGRVFPADALYEPIMLYEAVSRIGRQVLGLSDLKTLAAYDQKNHTDYLLTLKNYLSSENRITSASEKMFIDRGTMKYRLKKIRDLLDVDLDDPKTAALLYYGIKIYFCSSI